MIKKYFVCICALILLSVLVSNTIIADELFMSDILFNEASLVDTNYWQGQVEQRFDAFINEFMPSLDSLLDKAISNGWPFAGKLLEAGDAMKSFIRGFSVWKASEAFQLLSFMDAIADGQNYQRLSEIIQKVAYSIKATTPLGIIQADQELVAEALKTANYYRSMLISSQSDKFRRIAPFWAETCKNYWETRSSLNLVVFSIERTLEGLMVSDDISSSNLFFRTIIYHVVEART